MSDEQHPFLPSGWKDLPDPYRAAEQRVSVRALETMQQSGSAQLGLESRMRLLEQKAERTRQMVDGATIACDGGDVTLEWGAD